ncbi:MAG TPA: PEPxxWA-CTERM sorting domain-containing protein [Sphingomonas sp.]|uniref:PEPxxWA-CTERM sorting domain-containing protein n=1 Tax=Sphingomonas sp. TaxID=28214 RepID=UPI002C75433E|nr:PEPxxWA-CTERM sorting domain-containing protein [Sphingomonas sp.]HMI18032.1 PEPxxWA-CTERM sorting domain-containing protein [Sphingomonas sp.]
MIRSAVAVAGILCAAGIAAGAQATDIDTFINTNGGYTYIDPATGSINGTIHFAGNEGGEGAAVGRILLTGVDASNNAVSMPVYCIDVADWLAPGVFTKQALSSLSFTTAQQTAIVKFITYGDAQVNAASGFTKTLLSAATQLGVWEILNEAPSTSWNVLSGTFSASAYGSDTTILSAAAQANSWLNLLTANTLPTIPGQTLSVLNPGGGNQSQVYITARGGDDNIELGVPEPATWGMIVVGFGLLGAALRRRKPEELFA